MLRLLSRRIHLHKLRQASLDNHYELLKRRHWLVQHEAVDDYLRQTKGRRID